ncbi:hypothetical protein NFC73_04465 [Pseudarthrobacter sp. RMG13]|uniref:Copper transporter n=1 Tax=Pseudarthrobacter humi TaxID=2952523 RepID=A0ABT1LMS8_9MICC|nr:hypothetical protein [Pseudarthrobacter humi]MCP8998993.1 hypothetical protein [Pseudarthrobacter humi]
MHHLILALTTTPSPLPTPGLREGISEDQITPGLWGFIMTAFFVLATTLLIVDMVRRIRRVRYRAQVEEERQAAAEAADIEAADGHDGLGVAGDTDASGDQAGLEDNGHGQAADRPRPRD